MLPALKQVVAINALSASNGATVTSSVIDTLGFDFATIDIWGTTQSASTQAGSPSVLKLQESDTTVATTFADCVGFRGGSALSTSVDFLVGIGTIAATNPPNAYKMNVDCRSRKRYLSVVITPTTSQTFYAAANLGRAEQSPSTALKAGVLNLVEG
jgi:hypothetical protein